MTDPVVKDDGKGAGQGGDKGNAIDPVEYQNLKTSYENLNSLLGKQGNELGQLKSQLAQYESEKEQAALMAAENSKAQEFEAAISDISTKLAGIDEKITDLDVTDPGFTKELAKLQKEQSTLQEKRFQLAEQKGREETLVMANESIKKTLSERDRASEEGKVKKAIDQYHKNNPDFQEALSTGALDSIIKESDGFHDPVSAFQQLKINNLTAKLAEAEKRLKYAEGEGRTGTVITSSGQEINVNPKEKLSGQDRLDSRRVDAGMRAALRQAQESGG